MKFPFYKQPDMMDCGPTCLRMVAKYYGRSISLQSLRDKTQIGKEGVNLLGIGDAAEAIGFRTQSYRLNFDTLAKDAQLPAILHWNQNHFVVLYKSGKKKLMIADPANGITSLSPAEFKQHWISDNNQGKEEGIALLLEPAPGFYEAAQRDGDHGSKKTSLHFSNIFSYILPYKKLFLQVAIGLIIGSILQLFLPFLTQSIVDTGINTSNIHFVYVVLLAQLALFAGRLAIEFVRGWILLHISTRINISILTDFLIKLMRLPVAFFDSKKTGDILQRMNDHKRIELFLTGTSLNLLFSVSTLIIFSIVLLIFNPTIFLVFSAATILYTFWMIIFLKRREILDYRKFEVAAKEQSAMVQLVQGMQEIKLNGAERPMRWTWERLQSRLFHLNMKSLSLNQWQQAGSFFIHEGKNILITFLSAQAVINNQMTLGSMLAIQYIIGQLNSPIEQMMAFIQSWQNARISMDRLNEIHDMEDEEPAEHYLLQELPPSFARKLTGGRNNAIAYTDDFMNHDFTQRDESHDATNAISGSSENGRHTFDESTSITFRNVSFTYPGAGNSPVLTDINLSIPAGKTTAIVGASGSGKTTLLKLLLKFYKPQQGEIVMGNSPLSGISHKVLRSHCGVVMQESFIFSETIAKNIAVGQDKINMQQLNYASEIANIRPFIESLPLGYNTKIGPEGMGLSMGQKQRVLIARAVYRNPGFILFDEATNSLDANNESMIIKNLEAFFQNRTVIVVAHRLSTVRHADQIVVLNRGVITEKGTHQELTNLKGEYYQLVKNQLELGS